MLLWQCIRISRYSVPERLGCLELLLNEALVSLHTILPDFQKTNKLQKVQCIVLTDGEANSLSYHVTVRKTSLWDPEPYLGTRAPLSGESYVRDRKLGTTYAVKGQYRCFTDIMLRNLEDNFPNANFIRDSCSCSTHDANSFIRSYCDFGDDEFDRIQKDWKKSRFNIKSSGYDAYFGMSSATLSQESEFEVDDNFTSKQKIKSAFAKSLKTKKLNKKVLRRNLFLWWYEDISAIMVEDVILFRKLL